MKFNDNLTVIYGPNGTGKTGYVRIVKSMGNSLDSENTIYTNLLEDETTQMAFSVADAKYKNIKVIDNKNKMYKNKTHLFKINNNLVEEKKFLSIFFDKKS